MVQISAESAYLFRHALLRDAAYALQLPSNRQRLHLLALQLIEDVLGGRPAPVSPLSDLPWESHPSDLAAIELAHHAAQAARLDDSFAEVRRLYLYRAARLARDNFRREESVALWNELAELHEGADRAACLHYVGMENRQLGRRGQAGTALRSAIEIARDAGSRRQQCMATISLGRLSQEQGRRELAAQLQREAIAIARELGDGRSESIALTNLGALLRTAGDKDSARQAFDDAARVARGINDAQQEGTALANIAGMCGDAGQFAEAGRAYDRALELLRNARDVRTEANVLINLSIMFSISGRKPESENSLRASLLILRRIGNRADECVALMNLAMICRQTGKLEEAEQCFEQSLAGLRELGNRRTLGTTLGEYAVLLRETGRAAQALAAAEEAVAIHRTEVHRLAEASDGCELALCQLACGMHEKARATWTHAAPALAATGIAYALDEKVTAMREACAAAGIPPFESPSN